LTERGKDGEGEECKPTQVSNSKTTYGIPNPNLMKNVIFCAVLVSATSSKVVAMVHDNTSNVVATAEENAVQHHWVSVRCAAHSLQLVVNAALKSDSTITDSMTAARHVVEYFKISAIITARETTADVC